ncbi:MAG: DEAD/DEAH box helicase [Proteobacteria bacterium]|nr:DEAD/DEAH box helicase [Pseudomonadota bacterium]
METTIPTDQPGFGSFGLAPEVLRGLASAGFTEPRPIQVATLPAAMAGSDILGLAQTGTGKTAAFALPILQQIATGRGAGPHALILEPTRELAQQVDNELRRLAAHLRCHTQLIYGGVSARAQIDGLRRQPAVIVACPGRLVDLMRQGHVQLGRVRTLVLDEADHMFDMGFLPDLRRIVSALPAQRQNMLFSATMPHEIRGLANQLLRTPHVVELATVAPVETVEHSLCPTDEPDKLSALETLLRDQACTSAIVFSRTKHRAKRLALALAKNGHRAVALQGNMSQAQRDRAMEGFRRKSFDVLVATDIVARGIDVAAVSHVVNFDVPVTPEAYTHRLGRTGRSGLSGQAITFVTRDDDALVRAIERRLGAPIPRRTVDGRPLARQESTHDRRPALRAAPRSALRSAAPSMGRPAPRAGVDAGASAPCDRDPRGGNVGRGFARTGPRGASGSGPRRGAQAKH